MKTIKLFIFTLLIAAIAASCNKDDDGFTGEVTVTLINKGGTTAVEGEAAEFVYDVILSKSFDQNINLTFDLDSLAQYPGLLTIDPNPVVIAKNQTKGVLKVMAMAKPDAENLLAKNTNFKIKLSSYTGIDNRIVLESNETITIQAEEDVVPLTAEQRELVAHYKTQGIDVTPWIGKIPVEVTVKTAAGGNFSPFDVSETKTYTGVTHITLSENATKEKPLLAMTLNAFGLSEYLQYVFRHETILNKGFWYNPDANDMPPAPLAVLQALGQERVQKWINKEYPFNVMVDDLEFKADKSVVFVRENGAYSISSDFLPNGEKEQISAVNFQYEFPLWDELVTLADGNADLISNIQQGGSVHPNNYITYSTILTDDWGGTNWVAPTGSYDNAEKKMMFNFNTDHSNSGDYDIVTVTYTSPY